VWLKGHITATGGYGKEKKRTPGRERGNRGEIPCVSFVGKGHARGGKERRGILDREKKGEAKCLWENFEERTLRKGENRCARKWYVATPRDGHKSAQEHSIKVTGVSVKEERRSL